MSKQLKMLVGVAVFATLALAGTLGIFAFGPVQPVEAQGSPSATRTFAPDPVMPSTDVVVMINISGASGSTFAEITETLPTDFTYRSSPVSTARHNASNNTVRFVFFGTVPSSFRYTVTAPAATGDYPFSGTLIVADSDNVETSGTFANSTLEVSDTGGNGGGTMPMTRADSSVTARPDDPGAATQITVKFMTSEFLAVSESITFEIGDDFGVPSTIDADDVDIRGLTAESYTDDPSSSPKSANPQSVIVDTNDPDERFTIELFIGNMDDSADQPEDLGLAGGPVTVIFQQGAGLTNRTEGGKDDWFVKTSAEDMLAEIASANVYLVPRTIDLSTYGDPRGEEVTVIGKGFKNGTTTKFWRDANRNGMIEFR